MPTYRYILDPTYTIDEIPKNCVEQSNKNKYHKYIMGDLRMIVTQAPV